MGVYLYKDGELKSIAGPQNAADVYYDNTGTISSANNVQDALTNLNTNLTANGTMFQFLYDGVSRKYGYKDSSGNFVPFNKVQPSKTVSPSTSAQTVRPDSQYDGLGSVTVNAISPQRDPTTPNQATLSGYNTTGAYVWFPYGWWPAQNSTHGSYVYMTQAQAQAAHQHTGTRASVTANGTIDLGETHNIRYVPVNVTTYKIVKYVAVTKGNHAGGTVEVTRYDPDGTSQTLTTTINSNDSAGWPELSVWAWEHWRYIFYSAGTVYLDGVLRQNAGLEFASYDSGDDATHIHTVEVLIRA